MVYWFYNLSIGYGGHFCGCNLRGSCSVRETVRKKARSSSTGVPDLFRWAFGWEDVTPEFWDPGITNQNGQWPYDSTWQKLDSRLEFDVCMCMWDITRGSISDIAPTNLYEVVQPTQPQCSSHQHVEMASIFRSLTEIFFLVQSTPIDYPTNQKAQTPQSDPDWTMLASQSSWFVNSPAATRQLPLHRDFVFDNSSTLSNTQLNAYLSRSVER